MSSLNEEESQKLEKRTSNSLPRNMCLCERVPERDEKQPLTNVEEDAATQTMGVEDDCSTDEEEVNKIIQDAGSVEESKDFGKRAGKTCSERSDSGFSDCSVLVSNSCTSTPLLGKKFQINEEVETTAKTIEVNGGAKATVNGNSQVPKRAALLETGGTPISK